MKTKKRLAILLLSAVMSLSATAQNFGFGGNQQSQKQAQYAEKFADLNYAGDAQAYHSLDVYIPKTAKPEKG